MGGGLEVIVLRGFIADLLLGDGVSWKEVGYWGYGLAGFDFLPGSFLDSLYFLYASP